MNKNENQIENKKISQENIFKNVDQVEQFLIYIGQREELLIKFQNAGIINLETLFGMDEISLPKKLQNLSENQSKYLIKNINILEIIHNTDIDDIQFDLGGIPCTKEIVIKGFKMKNKSQTQTLSYQQNLEKNSKPENIFVSFLSNKNITKLTNLEVFKNMKHLYLSNNKIQKISNLENLTNLNIIYKFCYFR